MAKKSKKRNKKYAGVDAKTGPVKVTKIKAKQRSKLGEWYVDNKRRVISWLVIVGVGLILYGAISWILGLIF